MRLALLFVAALNVVAAPTPAWVRDAARQTHGPYPPKVTKVVLMQEEHLTVAPDGKRVIRERGAIKFLQRDREPVAAYRAYNTKSGRIRDFQAWLLTPDGTELALGEKNAIVDLALSESYDEARAKRITCPSDVPAGSVFAWEVTEEEKTVFTQYAYSFQGGLPVLASRFALTTPPGWESRGTMINGADVPAQVAGQTSTWEMRNLPWIPDEDYRPDTRAMTPRLGVTYFPSSVAGTELAPLNSWTAVSKWLTQFTESSVEVTEAIRDKAAELTKDARVPIDAIRSIAGFAQQTTYVSVQMNVTRGGGYTPNPASKILLRNYGDCKDKATLMRALLKAKGIDSFMTVLYSGDREFVRSQWPSPFQFNHAIIAVRVPDEVELPAVISHAKLGRLVIFDPTDPNTPFGHLPEEEQGSHALVVTADGADLVKLPLEPPARNHVHSVVTGSVLPDGALKANLRQVYSGYPAAVLRNLVGDEKTTRKLFEASLSQRLGGMTLASATLKKSAEIAKLEADVEFEAHQFGQVMQNRLLVLAPGLLVSDSEYVLADKPRTTPLKVRARSRTNTIRLKVPAGFEADEIPDAVSVVGEYGTFEASWAVKDGEVAFVQTVTLKDALVAPADYAKARKFFDSFAGAQGNAVVLVRK